MKTPREILLNRHQSANPKLDDLRTKVLSAALPNAPCAPRETRMKSPWPVRVALAVWRELIWPCRRAWAGMASLWLVMWGINRGLLDAPKPDLRAGAASAPALFEALEEQKRLLTELIPLASKPTEPPRRNLRPRSERHSETLMM